MDDRVGQQLGNYRLLRLLGRGGFASVYLGEHVYLKSHAALKVLHAALQDEDAERFVKEAQILVRLAHPHIVRVLDFAVEAGTPFLVMEYAPHGTLRHRHPKGARLPLDTIVSYVKPLASALQYAHDQRLIHRDVKPENMLLRAQADLLLSDFGFALLAPHTHSLSTQVMDHSVAGTAPYLAPEQLQGKPRTASDQYALGVVVYEWLCGTPPFRGSPIEIAMQHLSMPPPPLREQVPDIPPAAEQVVLRALLKEPKDRWASVQEFAIALEQASQEGPRHPSPKPSIQEVLSPPGQGQPDVPGSVPKPQPVWKVPVVFSPLVGREQEVTAMCALLKQPDVRLLTLLGTGGIGKTRLAVQIAREMRADFADGVCFVPLAAISDPVLVVPTMAEALSIQEIGVQPILEQLKVALQDRHLLLLLDNFEQVVAAAPQLEELLAACPSLKIVVTSREILHLQVERGFPLSPLSLPDLTTVPESGLFSHSAAVALFVQRAQAMLPTFQLTVANARAIAEICVRLDGLPLAIELAAARVNLLPPQVLLARLSQRFQVLTGGARTVPVRQQTLRNTLKWSYDLLDAQEQHFFRRLSVFAGGCTLEAVEAFSSESSEATTSVLDRVASLLDKSLLLQVEREGEVPRLMMLETVREYGLECLHESGEAAVSQRAHALYYLALVEEAEPRLRGGQQQLWLARLEREQENLRAALGWLIEQQEIECTLRLCGGLWRFWRVLGYWSEGRRWLQAAVALPSSEAHRALRARALYGMGVLTMGQGDYPIAQALLEESVALYRDLGDHHGLAASLSELGMSKYWQNDSTAAHLLLVESLVLARSVGDHGILASSLSSLAMFLLAQGDVEEGLPLLEESMALFREGGDTHTLPRTLTSLAQTMGSQGDMVRAAGLAREALLLARELGNKADIARGLYTLGNMLGMQGDYEQAVRLVQESLALYRELGDKRNIASMLGTLGYVALTQGDAAQAEERLQESLVLLRELGSKVDIGLVLSLLAEVRWAQRDVAQAKALFREGLSLALEVGRKINIGLSLIGLAKVAADEGQLEQAARAFGAAEPWLDPHMFLQLDPFRRMGYEGVVEHIRAQLGEEAFSAAWAEGRNLTPEQVLAAPEHHTAQEAIPATQTPPSPARPPAAPSYPDELSAREVEVLRLLAKGWTDAQIAERLVISPRTVNKHTTSIYSKIGVSSRSAATRYAIEHHLV